MAAAAERAAVAMADPFPELEGVLFLNAGLRREAEARVLVRRAEQLALQDAEGQVSTLGSTCPFGRVAHKFY